MNRSLTPAEQEIAEKLRPELLAFAERMEERLGTVGLVDLARQTRDATPWGAWLILQDRVRRLYRALGEGRPGTQAGRRHVSDAAADVANQAMLVAYAWGKQAEEGTAE